MTLDPWSYETAVDLDRSLSERLQDFPRQPDMLVYGARLLAAAAMRAWLRSYHRLVIRGREQIPAGKSFVLVANHASHLDAVVLALGAAHQPNPARVSGRRQRLISSRACRGRALASIVVNALPFNRERPIFVRAWRCSQRLLDTPGNVLILFPEGTRSPSGLLAEFKPRHRSVAGRHGYSRHSLLSARHARSAPQRGKLCPARGRLKWTIGSPRSYLHLKRGKDAALEISRRPADRD